MLLKEQVSDHAAIEVALEVESRSCGSRPGPALGRGLFLCVVHEKPG